MTLSFLHRPRKRAFTLIELLVVIAIIAILAAILFPVFAQARAKARQTTDLSNDKQITLGWLQYVQDYDETVVPYGVNTNMNYQGNTYTTVKLDWPVLLQSYMTSWPVLWSPGQTLDPYNIWTGPPSNAAYEWPANWEVWPAFAYNTDYMDINMTCSGQSAPFSVKKPHPILYSKIVSPAQMVAFVDAKVVGSAAAGGYYPSNQIGAPASNWSPNTCDYEDSGFGAGATGDTYNFAPPNNTGTGEAATWFVGGTNTAFADGHVKWLTPGQLAAGTNWTVTIPTNNIVVTNPAAYIWCYDPNVL